MEVFQDFLYDVGVLFDLEIEHADSDEVGSVFEGELEAGFGVDGAGGEDFETDPGFFNGFHKGDGLFGIYAPHIIVIGTVF